MNTDPFHQLKTALQTAGALTDQSLKEIERLEQERDQLKQQLAQAQAAQPERPDIEPELKHAGWLSPDEAKDLRELHIMNLAGISTASIQNTESTVKDRITRDNPYWTQAYEDVCRAVDREMAHRDEAKRLEADAAAVREVFDKLVSKKERGHDPDWVVDLYEQALSTTAGRSLLERLERYEKRNVELCHRITGYLSAGGLFNPESMEHNKVRDLLIDCREALKGDK